MGPGGNFGISTPGPFQAPILRQEDLRHGGLTASSTRMPNFSSGVKSLQFGLQSLRTVGLQGPFPGRVGASCPLCRGSAGALQPLAATGSRAGVSASGCSPWCVPVLSFPRVLQQGPKPPGMVTHQFSPTAAGDTRPKAWNLGWCHVKEARFDDSHRAQP